MLSLIPVSSLGTGKGCLLNRCGHCYNHGNKTLRSEVTRFTGGKTEAALVFYYDAFNCC